ncbi:DUF4166 domain-containing protein [Xylophilus sp. Kf1]|nr:DUF4166 domain-containing protein [Xylophilus sp. Kf1]
MREASIYQQAMGPAFGKLPKLVQQFHMLQGVHRLSGSVEIIAPVTVLAKLLARCLGTPLVTQKGALRFELRADTGLEIWVRHFPGKTMKSEMVIFNGSLVERIGFARVAFSLQATSKKLEMKLAKLHFLGVPCPTWLLPVIVAEETESEGKLYFFVQAALPFIGLVTHYKGYLVIPEGEVK